MLIYILKRVLQGVLVVFGVILLIFIIIRVIPGDPARLIAAGGATPEGIEKIRHELGLDRPLAVQFADYVVHVAKGDLETPFFAQKGGAPITACISSLPNPSGPMSWSMKKRMFWI